MLTKDSSAFASSAGPGAARVRHYISPMKLRRDEFIANFSIPFHVHCLKLWSRRASTPPYSVARCCYEWIGTTNGSVNLKVL